MILGLPLEALRTGEEPLRFIGSIWVNTDWSRPLGRYQRSICIRILQDEAAEAGNHLIATFEFKTESLLESSFADWVRVPSFDAATTWIAAQLPRIQLDRSPDESPQEFRAVQDLLKDRVNFELAEIHRFQQMTHLE